MGHRLSSQPGSTGPKVLITHAYSVENKGDAALLGVLVSEIRRVFDPSGIRILTLDNVASGTSFEGVQLERSFMSAVRYKSDRQIVRVVYGLWMTFYTLAWAKMLRRFGRRLPLPKDLRRCAEAYEWADVVIPVGGGYLRGLQDVASIFNLLLLIHPLYFGGYLGKPTILFTQSVGPFYWEIERRMMRSALEKNVDLILIREEKSMELLQTLGADAKAERSVDAGFLVEAKAEVALDSLVSGRRPELPLVGITVRKWLDEAGQHAYETAVAELADYIVDNDLGQVVFIPQVTAQMHADDDRVASKSVSELMRNKEKATVLMDEFGYREIRALYGDLDILVGTRFHSVIFALISFVPCMAIEYEHKTSGILRDLGLEEWSRPIETVTGPQLIELFTRLLAERSSYATLLKDSIPPYVIQAQGAIERAKHVFDARNLGAKV